MKFKAYIVPQSSKSMNCGSFNDGLKIKIKSPPVDGKANEEVIRFLAELLSIPKKQIEIKHGHTSKTKLIEITATAAEELSFRKILGLS